MDRRLFGLSAWIVRRLLVFDPHRVPERCGSLRREVEVIDRRATITLVRWWVELNDGGADMLVSTIVAECQCSRIIVRLVQRATMLGRVATDGEDIVEVRREAERHSRRNRGRCDIV